MPMKLIIPNTGKRIHHQPYWMMEFKDENNVKRFFRMEDQLEKSDNETLSFMMSMLDPNDKDEGIFYRTL